MSASTLLRCTVNACVTASQATFQTVAFVDSRVEDLPTLLASLNPDITAYILHPEANGIEQINAVLQQGHVHSFYLIGHGAPGMMQLGQGELSAVTVTAAAAVVSGWQVQEILLYGCWVML